MIGATHRLKTIACFWDAIAAGRKTFEARKNDRDFQTGDILELVRMPDTPAHQILFAGGYPPQLLTKRVTYILHGGQFGIELGYCVMGIVDHVTEADPMDDLLGRMKAK